MVVRSTMLKELLWRKHEGTRTCTFLMWMCVRTQHTLQILWKKVCCFGMKDLAISTWQALRSLMPWLMTWIWKKCRCIAFVKDAWKENIKEHHFSRTKQQGLHNFWRLCTLMCASQWRLHHMVERDTFSLSLTIFQGKLMFIFWRSKEKRLKNSNHTRCWWETKLVTKSKCYDLTMEENLCLRSLTHAFLAECGIQRQTSAPYSPQQNGVVECANRFIMECAKNMTLHKGWNLNFGAKRWTRRCTSKIDVQPRLLIPRPLKKRGMVQNLMCLIWEFLVIKPLHMSLMRRGPN